MKIIEPSARIIEDELAGMSIYQRIDQCASVCYQRPPKATEDEAKEFCKSMLERKHMMPLEMAQVYLLATEADVPKSKFVTHTQVAGLTKGRVVISGSIRAFLEAKYHDREQVRRFLSHKYPLFFGEDVRETYVKFAREDQIPWQHRYVAVRVVCSRAISHQLVRHRPVSILQESQRYCRYDGERFEGEVTFIRPLWVDNDLWMDGFRLDCYRAEDRYKTYLLEGLSPQQARGVLPSDCKTELIMYASLPEWKYILNTDTMRCSPHADPEMRRIMLPLREEFMGKYPEVGW